MIDRIFAWLADKIAYPVWIYRFLARNRKVRNGIIWFAVLSAGIIHFFGAALYFALLRMLLQFVFAFAFMIFQFVGIFWFLSRPKTITVLPGDKTELTLADYWGQPALVELMNQWLTILRGDQAFQEMGGEPIRGLLLQGKPGTGKTYLMKCLAGSAGIALHGIEGSSFRAMFWGVDVLRVLNYLAKCRGFALRHGACIAFIDEIDSIGSSRGAVQGGGQGQFRGPMGFMGGTGALTTLLAQMDGIGEQREFTTCRNIARKWLGVEPVQEGFVMFVGSTNRPDVLDAALTRPGRLDRRIQVDPPDGPGRKEIFGGYLKRIKHGGIDLDYLVAHTQGMTPAAIAMAVTRDAVRNARFRNLTEVEQRDVELALMEQVIGMANPIGDLDPTQKRQIAVHEAGHAVALHYLNPDKRIVFLSIVRRELGLGLMLPVDVKATYTIPLKRLIADIRVSLAGDVAVEVCLGERWTGGAADFRHVRDRVHYLAWHGVFGTVLSIDPAGKLPEDVSERISKWLAEQREATNRLLRTHKTEVEALADALVDKQDLTGEEVLQIIRKSG